MIWSLSATEKYVVPIVVGDETAAISGQKCARPRVCSDEVSSELFGSIFSRTLWSLLTYSVYTLYCHYGHYCYPSKGR